MNEAGSVEQGAGSREHGAWSMEQGAGSREPTGEARKGLGLINSKERVGARHLQKC